MIILGLILIVLALAAALFLVLGTSALEPIPLEVLNQTYEMSPLALVISGAIAMTLLWWGWALIRMGTRRRVRKSREAKEAARQAELDRAAQEKENQSKWERELRDRERQVRESEARLAEQKVSTDEARRRAAVAERRAEADPVEEGRPTGGGSPADGSDAPRR